MKTKIGAIVKFSHRSLSPYKLHTKDEGRTKNSIFQSTYYANKIRFFLTWYHSVRLEMAGIWNVAGPEVNGYVLLAIDRKSLKWNKRYTRMKQHFRLIIEWPNTNWIWALIFCQAAKFYLCLIFVNLDTQILKECSLHNSLRDVERRKTKRLLPVQFWLFQRSLHEHCVPVG